MNWKEILKRLKFTNLRDLHEVIDDIQDVIMNMMMSDLMTADLERLTKDLEYIRQEKDLYAATEMLNALETQVNKLYDDYNESTGMQIDIEEL